jgi:tagatose 1,6-diphosphate aldolase
MHLPALQTTSKMIGVLELDKVISIANALGLDLKEESNQKTFSRVLDNIIRHLAPAASGLVLEPNYGLPLFSAQNHKAGLALALDTMSSDEVDPLALPQLTQNWGVAAIRNNYAMAKITLYYHPEEEVSLKEKQLIAEIYDHCQHEGIDLMLKLMLYTQADEEFSAEQFQAIQLQAVSEFRNSCNLLALQYPQNSLACATITSELDIPWVVVGDGQDYDSFKEVVRDSLEGGAAGYLAGDVFWQEIKTMRLDDTTPDFEAIENFLETTGRDRVLELTRIIDEFADGEIDK